MIVFLFIYAFYNPDNKAWIGKVEGEIHLFEFEKSHDYATDVVNIHLKFKSWFKSGFFLHTFCIIIAVGFVGIAFKICNYEVGQFCVCIQTLLYSCLWIAWWILGIVTRFSKYGRYASGDEIPEGMNREDWQAEIREEDSLY